eukprot:GHRR01031431.1.p1 GENE.GHRR01031431.1~~GHRR01031431.1.p1  ORF type:complete len:176 (+),score=45.20 GHRR01031431.1:466-993(+)
MQQHLHMQFHCTASATGSLLPFKRPWMCRYILPGSLIKLLITACATPAVCPAGIDEHTPDLRVFRNYIGTARNDDTEGSDNWAVSRGWISITPLSLRQDVPARLASDTKESTSVLATVSAIIQLAAQKALLAVAKLPPAANLPSNGNKVTVTEPAGGTDQQGLPTASDVLVKPKA